MGLEKIAEKVIDPGESDAKLLYPKGNTQDIITVIMMADAQSDQYTAEFAKAFEDIHPVDQCEDLYFFVQDNISYKEDPAGKQWIKSPSQLWTDKEGDCKSFSLFIGSVLKNLGIPFIYRFAGYDAGGDVTHVYVVAYPDGEEIIMDAVPPMTYNEEAEGFKKTINKQPAAVSGLLQNTNSPEVIRSSRVRGVESPLTPLLWILGIGAILFLRK